MCGPDGDRAKEEAGSPLKSRRTAEAADDIMILRAMTMGAFGVGDSFGMGDFVGAIGDADEVYAYDCGQVDTLCIFSSQYTFQ